MVAVAREGFPLNVEDAEPAHGEGAGGVGAVAADGTKKKEPRGRFGSALTPPPHTHMTHIWAYPPILLTDASPPMSPEVASPKLVTCPYFVTCPKSCHMSIFCHMSTFCHTSQILSHVHILSHVPNRVTCSGPLRRDSRLVLRMRRRSRRSCRFHFNSPTHRRIPICRTPFPPYVRN